jgi:hypothetical protein
MGADDFDNHIKPAVAAGGRSFWLTQQTLSDCPILSLSLQLSLSLSLSLII